MTNAEKCVARGGCGAEAVKKLIRERDGHKCVKCGMTAAEHRRLYGTRLEVHRLQPGSLYTLDGCITTCRACNAKLPRLKAGEIDLEHKTGRGTLFVELSAGMLDRLKEFAESRGQTIRHVIERAIIRHLDSPPPLLPDPPLPPCEPERAPAKKPAKPRKRK